MLTQQEIVRALGGEVHGNEVVVPGPNYSPTDRSLSVKLDAGAPDGFVLHSFADDDPIRCKDYVREKLRFLYFRNVRCVREQTNEWSLFARLKKQITSSIGLSGARTEG